MCLKGLDKIKEKAWKEVIKRNEKWVNKQVDEALIILVNEMKKELKESIIKE